MPSASSILFYFLKQKEKKFLCRTSELGYTLQVSQVSRQLQKSSCDVTSYKTTVGVLQILKFSDFLTCISFNCTFHWQWLFYLYVRSRVTSRLSEMKQNHGWINKTKSNLGISSGNLLTLQNFEFWSTTIYHCLLSGLQNQFKTQSLIGQCFFFLS